MISTANARPDAAPAVLPVERWQVLRAAHQARVDALLSDHLDRSRKGIPHPVEDFLFTYYSLRPGQLRRWHPGRHRALADAQDRAGWRFYRVLDPARNVVGVDETAFLAARGTQLGYVRRLVAATAAAPAQFGCFGLHEWAMVYRQDQVRHPRYRLRLGRADTDQVVRDHQLRCTHYDAFRFFSPAARPQNQMLPTLDSRVELAQPGCLHEGMDVYKWAYRLLPAVSSDLVVDAFELARSIREIDMRASPYDLSGLGLSPIRIETTAGKAEYVAAQRRIAARAQTLRRRLLDELPPQVPDASG